MTASAVVAEVELELQAARVRPSRARRPTVKSSGAVRLRRASATPAPRPSAPGSDVAAKKTRHSVGSIWAAYLQGRGDGGIPTTRLFTARLPVEVKNPV